MIVPRAALFDLDRTLVRRETASLFVRYQRDVGQATWVDSARTAFWILQYSLGLLDAPGVAEKALRRFAGAEASVFAANFEDWFRRYVLSHVSEAGREAVKRHREAGDIVAIVTGAIRYAAKPLADELGIEHLVATDLAVEQGRLTGKPVYPLCYGEGKITHTLELAERLGFSLSEATFYTDSATDLPMLARVKSPVAVNPDIRLRMIAARRGWPVLSW
jgi:HAD superfamily hydrolase (TIGR01490 family)